LSTYTITINDELEIGLLDQLASINAQAKIQRKPTVPDIATMLTQAAVGLAQQGINALAQAAAQQVAAIALESSNTITPEKLVDAVRAYAVADADTQAQIKQLLNIA
jgi:hypothetical protein